MRNVAAPAPAGPLIGYRLRTVRVGAWVTALTLLVLATYAALPGHGTIHIGSYTAALIVGALAVVLVVLLPWERFFETSVGQWAMYIWCAGDIALITFAVWTTGGSHSEIWVIYALTTLFFAASYPPRGQAALLALTAAGYAIALAATGWEITAAALLLRASFLGIVFLMAMFLSRELQIEMGRHAEASLRARFAEAQAERAEWFRSLVQDSTDIVTTFDEVGTILYVSPAIRTFGYEPDDLIGTDVSNLVHPEDLERAYNQLVAMFEGEYAPRPLEYRARTADGTWRYLEGVATNLLDEPTVNAVVVDARDVTERKNAEMLATSQSRVLEQIAAGEPLDAVLHRIAVMVEEQAQAQCTVLLNGTDEARLIVVSSDPRDPGGLAEGAGWSRAITSADSSTAYGEVRLRFSGTRFATEREQRVADAAASLAAIAVERDFAKARLAHQARHDTLTGLPNRQVFLETLETALTSARSEETIAVLFIDLDGFKDVNDSFGHHVGDQVLIALGHRLIATMRKHDAIARFGGDEFVALCHVDGPDHAMHLAERILTRVREPIAVGSSRVRLDASIGITLASLFADDGPRWVVNAAWVQAATDELLRKADAAMYRAKEAGGGRAELHFATPHPNLKLRAAGDEDVAN
jgi:diguanylate cyclase (GGDEF)-like protein/PAS domain S-box-containing protein